MPSKSPTSSLLPADARKRLRDLVKLALAAGLDVVSVKQTEDEDLKGFWCYNIFVKKPTPYIKIKRLLETKFPDCRVGYYESVGGFDEVPTDQTMIEVDLIKNDH